MHPTLLAQLAADRHHDLADTAAKVRLARSLRAPRQRPRWKRFTRRPILTHVVVLRVLPATPMAPPWRGPASPTSCTPAPTADRHRTPNRHCTARRR